MYLKRINILISLLFVLIIYKIPENNFLKIDVSKYNTNLEKGAVYYYGDYDATIICGHSGWGISAVFNGILNLNDNDYFYLNDTKYKVIRKKQFNKGSKLFLKDNKKYLYLITCDIVDFDKQVLIWAKKV